MIVSNRIAALIVAAALSLVTAVGAFNAAHAASETGAAAPIARAFSR